MDTSFQPVTKRGPRGKYRQHSQEFKRMVVELAMQPGASVARIARDHGVNANQVFSWRRLYNEGRARATASGYPPQRGSERHAGGAVRVLGRTWPASERLGFEGGKYNKFKKIFPPRKLA